MDANHHNQEVTRHKRTKQKKYIAPATTKQSKYCSYSPVHQLQGIPNPVFVSMNIMSIEIQMDQINKKNGKLPTQLSLTT